ncbi:ATP-binding cassette domain-containing protein [Alcanivorax sp. JB21]|uniref:ATP-binding cassette domain-containing protein n=1 Tax=Alcanivorax limicola TaxID=2874102 RepID=UPI001CBD6308|nr:ATP-binding cassette domain-containing protein [Alcanivorax limicola]MBZ2189590.1 ATP-binding cassette domain-containing protein [Alcanivorax limicola]
MPLLTLRNIQLSFGAAPLLSDVELSIDKGERLCLVGRNGAGKSTLMKIIAGEIQADDGSIEQAQGLRVARLVQEVPHDTDGSVFDVVAAGLGEEGRLLSEYQHLTRELMDGGDAVMQRFEKVQAAIDDRGAWDISQRVETVLSRLNLDGDTDFAGLSGGMKRRVLLAQSLVQAPDILLLDEPTNHLDIEAIRWLEDFLRQYEATLVFITHDRAFIRALATRIIEIDRGSLTSWPGNYERYLEGKQAALDAEEKANAEFDKKLSREETWIRQGIKARRTRNEGRVRALKALRQAHAERRQRQGNVQLAAQDANRSGKLVIEAEGLYQAYGEQSILRDFSLTVMRGDRIGVIGPNGCGKSTLLKILLGHLQPDAGSVQLGTKLDVAYFDQLRNTLDDNKSVIENVTEGSDILTINGQPRHAIGYLQDFLFEPQRARQPVSALSGGERNRLLLAKLFTRPFNLLVLDEPTNDLDAETLDLLEEQLMAFEGTLLLVSHDREFIDNVVTSTLVFEDGTVNEYVGGYQDWLRQRNTGGAASASGLQNPGQSAKKTAQKKDTAQKNVKKLSYAEKLELEKLPAELEALEAQIDAMQQAMADPGFYQQTPADIADFNQRLAALQAKAEVRFARWEALDNAES